MRFIFGFSLIICRVLLLFGLESSLFDDDEWNFLDASAATIFPGAVSSDLDWTAETPGDIFDLDSDPLNSFDGDDLVFENSAITDACVNLSLHPLRRRRGQNQMQCGTEPLNHSGPSPQITESSPEMAPLYNHELCPGYRTFIYAVCDSGNRFDRQAHPGLFFDLTACTLREFAIFFCHRRPSR